MPTRLFLLFYVGFLVVFRNWLYLNGLVTFVVLLFEFMILFFEDYELELLNSMDCDLLSLLVFDCELSYSLLFAFSSSCFSLIESSSRDFNRPLLLLVGEFMIDKALCNYFGLFNAISKKLGTFLSGSTGIGFLTFTYYLQGSISFIDTIDSSLSKDNTIADYSSKRAEFELSDLLASVSFIKLAVLSLLSRERAASTHAVSVGAPPRVILSSVFGSFTDSFMLNLTLLLQVAPSTVN